jgi:hypothetical protein
VAIEVTCACGRRLRIAERFAGKEGTCPACNRNFLIPGVNEADDTELIQAQPDPPSPPLDDLPEALPAPVPDRRSDPDIRAPLTNHADGRLPKDADFFVPAPREIGPLNSAFTTLRRSKKPWELAPRLLLAGAFACLGVLCGGGLDLITRIHNPIFLAFWPLLLAGLGFLITWLVTRFKHTCTYVGRDGVARFVCSSARDNLITDDVFLFEDAIDLRTSQTRRYVNGVYQGTDYSHIWTDVGGRTRFVLKGTYRAQDGNPASRDPFHFAQAAELAWTVYLISDALRQIETNGWVPFRLGSRKVIRLGVRRIQFHWGDDPERWEENEVGEAVIQQGVVKIKHADAREGWFSSEGVYKFNFSELANARLFFHLMDKVVQCPVR